MSHPRPLTEPQARVLVALHNHERTEHNYGMAPARIGLAIGADAITGGGHPGVGRGHRVFSPAQQIIPVLTGLRRRGLIVMAERRNEPWGVAYRLTIEGQPVAAALSAARTGADQL